MQLLAQTKEEPLVTSRFRVERHNDPHRARLILGNVVFPAEVEISKRVKEERVEIYRLAFCLAGCCHPD